MPVAAVVESKIFCCHGGLSPSLRSLDQINALKRPVEVEDTGLLCDILWSDPTEESLGWSPNERGVSFVFGADVLRRFLRHMDLDLVVRGHQVVEDGYEFFGQRGLVTIFSAPNYCGEFDNAGAMMSIDEDLLCSFQIIKPRAKVMKEETTSTNSMLRPLTGMRMPRLLKKALS
ncbi:hypothetical protein AB6A40_010208 [Gnathostoma spinigerum]|uniref:protein-serine/threonine phosphatase n=1 Tax=Gnathostoma spinigerum TaxID=75299 RepID=A0ABD6EZ92_9BILA